MTLAAIDFLRGIEQTWDCRSMYEDTASLGLSDTDAAVLAELCEEWAEDYATAEAEVLDEIKRKCRQLTN